MESGAAGAPPTADDAQAGTSANAVAKARQAVERSTSEPEPADSLDTQHRRVTLKRHEHDTALAQAMGWSVLVLFVFQAVAIDAGFLIYANETHWQLPEAVIISWLGAGVIQVIGSVALVIARYLFPGSSDDTADAAK
jgi:hypothetical protein